MPIDVTLLVTTTRPPADPLEVRLPGGVSIAAIPQVPIPDAATMTRTLLAQLNAALAPLAPVLRLVDFAISAFDTISSIPAAFVDPSELIENIERLAQNANALASFTPAVGVPRLAGDFVDLMISYLDGMIDQLQAIQALQVRIAAAQAQVGTYPQLSVVVDAANADVAVHIAAMNDGMGPVGTLIRLANLILKMAGIAPISELPGVGSDVSGTIEALGAAVTALRSVRASLPV